VPEQVKELDLRTDTGEFGLCAGPFEKALDQPQIEGNSKESSKLWTGRGIDWREVGNGSDDLRNFVLLELRN
jgi:hypothetical protein